MNRKEIRWGSHAWDCLKNWGETAVMLLAAAILIPCDFLRELNEQTDHGWTVWPPIAFILLMVGKFYSAGCQ